MLVTPREGAEDLFALRRGKPMILVLHIVTADHGWRSVSSRGGPSGRAGPLYKTYVIVPHLGKRENSLGVDTCQEEDFRQCGSGSASEYARPLPVPQAKGEFNRSSTAAWTQPRMTAIAGASPCLTACRLPATSCTSVARASAFEAADGRLVRPDAADERASAHPAYASDPWDLASVAESEADLVRLNP